jgi:predicted ester cyclase
MPVQETASAKDLVRRYLNDVFSRGDFGVIDQYLAGEKFTRGAMDLATRWRTAFPDLRIDVEDVIVEGDKVVTEEKMTGTHTGTYWSSSTGLTVDATGREVTWTRLAVRTLRDDRFVDGFWEEDEVGLLQQLGILQTPAAGSE